MPVVTFDYNDFIDLLGYKISKNELIKILCFAKSLPTKPLPLYNRSIHYIKNDLIEQ